MDQKGPGEARRKNRKGTTLIRAMVMVLGRLNVSRLLVICVSLFFQASACR